MRVLDLKFAWHLGHLPSMKEGRPYVYWQTRFFSGHGLRACPCLSAVRGTVSRQLQGQEFLLSRSVSLHGVCPAHLPGKSARYRNMPSIPTAEAVPYGYPRQGVALNDRRCQRTERLAHLCRSGACTDSYSPQAVQQRASLPSSWNRPSMPSMRRRSICVSPCFLGHTSGKRKARSSCIRSWTSAAASRRSFTSPTENSTRSTPST